MELILSLYAATSLVLLVVHLVDYFTERSPLTFAQRTAPLSTEDPPPDVATTSLQGPAERYDRAA